MATCGIVCPDCSAHIATQSADPSALEQVAAQWQEEYNLERVIIGDVTSDGCLGEEVRKGSHGFECDIRAWGQTRGAAGCAHCPACACQRLERFFGLAPDARGMLDQIRASL